MLGGWAWILGCADGAPTLSVATRAGGFARAGMEGRAVAGTPAEAWFGGVCGSGPSAVSKVRAGAG
jgi:hypothetical protein